MKKISKTGENNSRYRKINFFIFYFFFFLNMNKYFECQFGYVNAIIKRSTWDNSWHARILLHRLGSNKVINMYIHIYTDNLYEVGKCPNHSGSESLPPTLPPTPRCRSNGGVAVSQKKNSETATLSRDSITTDTNLQHGIDIFVTCNSVLTLIHLVHVWSIA